jgi:hypothetical protein
MRMQPAGGGVAERLDRDGEDQSASGRGRAGDGSRRRKTRKSKRFRTDESATKISLPRLHRISPLRCIVVLVDARNFRENATGVRLRDSRIAESSAIAEWILSPSCRGSLTRRTSVFPPCEWAISDLSSPSGRISMTMNSGVTRSVRSMRPSRVESTTARRLRFLGCWRRNVSISPQEDQQTRATAIGNGLDRA